MDYKKQSFELKLRHKYNRMGVVQLSKDLCNDCLEAAKSIDDLLARAEDAEAAQETLQRSMAEYKARAEKAEKCIAEIQSARDHTRPPYVVDEILRRFYDKKSFDELSEEAKKLYRDILTGQGIKENT